MSALDLTLKHYAHEPVMEFSRDREYRESRYDKPSGFWVSVEGKDDWKSWCSAEGFATDTLANEHDVKLAPGATILLIDSLAKLYTFSDEYRAGTELYGLGIHWDLLDGWYDGIIIAPYQWPARLNQRTDWYYSWDVASGCIWNLDALESVTPARIEVMQ